MSDEKALLAIWEHPHDDTVRLIYADWLQENGRPARAEFIRLQCDRARLTSWDDRSRELDAAVTVLNNRHWETWGASIPQRYRGGFDRGFPFGRMRASGQRFARADPALISLAVLWRLSSTQLTRGWTKAVESSNFVRVAEIDASGTAFTASRVQRVADSQNAYHLKRVQFQFCGLNDRAGIAFMQSPHLRYLDVLGLGANKLTDATVTAMKGACFAATLRVLQLGGNQIGSDGARTLASGAFANLVELDLSGCELGDTGIRELTRGSGLPRLRYLGLRYVGMSDVGLADLVGWSGLAGVKSLDLSGNSITPASVTPLLDSPHLAGVRRCQIDLSETPLETNPRIRAVLREQFHHVVFDPRIRD
ncbi:Repeat-companion domain TIGR02996 OS=Singulisphaera acidiphila (strain ATCC BAA-1392 / DSM 18658 / VKM B-2454 / MOB10) GN=Sinac_4455 PE=4 SV=1: LRR_6: LRR_6 [Gemmata massiliana]|uniref:Repeat-companion domain protein n=1 Tax=Gemmata massiliana TaxID=1210884 RepID=A0A6P2CVT4_9BACT|nr:TIGR02996 domain-containing protein [Gemmata massiliana]VTR93013.1 Repeat-companion domain TIGR02996 OS=Singulisphaera acidiphila (strain ATCC BAA-1392 / DSM 18658 / VKM B-2454 / MOB10) GN=Sinac_4455 PE=4 SV=1: LRR_6: LRR_6 [Gemmata massiliana]